jgi:hypothetical protein
MFRANKVLGIFAGIYFRIWVNAEGLKCTVTLAVILAVACYCFEAGSLTLNGQQFGG